MTQMKNRTTLMSRSLFTGVLLLATAGCSIINRGPSRSSPSYRITTNREIDSRGTTGEATRKNISSRQLEYNLCQRRLERQVNKYWVVAFEWPTAGGSCTTEARRLPKDESVTTLFDIPTGVPIGKYRLVFTSLRGKDGRSISSDDASTPSFDVR
jgi:hypothetical protein